MGLVESAPYHESVVLRAGPTGDVAESNGGLFFVLGRLLLFSSYFSSVIANFAIGCGDSSMVGANVLYLREGFRLYGRIPNRVNVTVTGVSSYEVT